MDGLQALFLRKNFKNTPSVPNPKKKKPKFERGIESFMCPGKI